MSAPNDRLLPTGLWPSPTCSQSNAPLPAQNPVVSSRGLPGTTSVTVFHPPAANFEALVTAGLLPHVLSFLRNVFPVTAVSREVGNEVVHVTAERRRSIDSHPHNGRSLLRRSLSSSSTGCLDTQGFYLFVRAKISHYRGRCVVDPPRLPYPEGTMIPIPSEIDCFDQTILDRENASVLFVWGSLSRVITREHPQVEDMPRFREGVDVPPEEAYRAAGNIRAWMEENRVLCHGFTVESLPFSNERVSALTDELEALIEDEERMEEPEAEGWHNLPDAQLAAPANEERDAAWRERQLEELTNRLGEGGAEVWDALMRSIRRENPVNLPPLELRQIHEWFHPILSLPDIEAGRIGRILLEEELNHPPVPFVQDLQPFLQRVPLASLPERLIPDLTVLRLPQLEFPDIESIVHVLPQEQAPRPEPLAGAAQQLIPPNRNPA